MPWWEIVLVAIGAVLAVWGLAYLLFFLFLAIVAKGFWGR